MAQHSRTLVVCTRQCTCGYIPILDCLVVARYIEKVSIGICGVLRVVIIQIIECRAIVFCELFQLIPNILPV